jgi:Protein of unknown function (DUF4232)
MLLGSSAAVVVAVAVLAAAAFGSGASTPRCATSNLRLDRVGTQGFTSHREWTFALRNVGPVTCHLKGYPGVGYLDGSANHINVNVARKHPASHPNVVLHPWKRAFFRFVWVIGGVCPHSFNASGVEVFPPNSVAQLVFYSGNFNVCAPGHPGGNSGTVDAVTPTP